MLNPNSANRTKKRLWNAENRPHRRIEGCIDARPIDISYLEKVMSRHSTLTGRLSSAFHSFQSAPPEARSVVRANCPAVLMPQAARSEALGSGRASTSARSGCSRCLTDFWLQWCIIVAIQQSMHVFMIGCHSETLLCRIFAMSIV